MDASARKRRNVRVQSSQPIPPRVDQSGTAALIDVWMMECAADGTAPGSPFATFFLRFAPPLHLTPWHAAGRASCLRDASREKLLCWMRNPGRNTILKSLPAQADPVEQLCGNVCTQVSLRGTRPKAYCPAPRTNSVSEDSHNRPGGPCDGTRRVWNLPILSHDRSGRFGPTAWIQSNLLPIPIFSSFPFS